MSRYPDTTPRSHIELKPFGGSARVTTELRTKVSGQLRRRAYSSPLEARPVAGTKRNLRDLFTSRLTEGQES
jgi:hypothetical protein